MKCENCGTFMEMEEWFNEFLCDDDQICLREEFWCPNCNNAIIKRTYYKKIREEVQPNA